MVLDFKVNRRLVVGTTINFFAAYINTPNRFKSFRTARTAYPLIRGSRTLSCVKG